MKKITAIILTVVLTAMGAMMIFAQTDTNTDGKREFGKKGNHGKRGGKRGHRGGGKGMMLSGVDLTDAQKAQVKQIMETSRTNMKTVHEQMKANRQQLEASSENGNFNQAQVQSLAAQQGNLHAQMIVEKERVKSQIYQILTPEQKAKAAEMKAQMEQKRQERQQKRAERKAQKDAATDNE
jgi:periplasmic protein CpxP/Spy